MNYLVFLDPIAGELEKILSGTKSMVMKEFSPASASGQIISRGDNLYFLRNKDDCYLRVKANVSRVLSFTSQTEGDLAQVLKEFQPRLQMTEEQFNHWSVIKHTQLIEFEGAQKIGPIHISDCKLTKQSDWMAFEDFDLVTGSKPQINEENSF
jgi:hypothetical protein